jgi:hypothetical protein
MAHDLESIEQSDVHHEESDVNFRAILLFGVALVVSGIVIHAAVGVLFVYLNGRQAEGPMQFPLAAGAARIPPEPRLQVDPPAELSELRAGEDEVLNGYRWVDRDAGTVRIPVTEAMRLVVERGLPARETTGEPPQ